MWGGKRSKRDGGEVKHLAPLLVNTPVSAHAHSRGASLLVTPSHSFSLSLCPPTNQQPPPVQE